MKRIPLWVLKEEMNPHNGYSVDDLIDKLNDFHQIPVHVFGGGEDEFDDIFRSVIYHPVFIPNSWWGGELPRMIQWGEKKYWMIDNKTGREIVAILAENID